jgi:hypothetical protein
MARGDATCALTEADELRCWGAQVRQIRGVRSASVGRDFVCWVDASDVMSCSNDLLDQAGVEVSFVAQVAAGDRHVCALRVGGEVSCWWGAVVPAVDMPMEQMEAIASGADVSCGVLTGTGLVKCWGGQSLALEVPDDVRLSKLAIGRGYGCGILPSGVVSCWGDVVVRGAAPQGMYETLGAGDHHLCALRADGLVVCWGADAEGNLGAPMQSL